MRVRRSEEHTSELQSHRDLHSFPTRRSSDLRTTLHPQLGVVRLNATEEFVLADIPGLIEGAHEGAGLGDRFLGHVERCAVLLHLVDGTQPDPAGAWRTVRAELAGYGGGLAEKPELVAL